MFDNLSYKLDRAFKTLKGTGTITEINVATTVKEIRRALIDADVNYKVAKEVTDTIREQVEININEEGVQVNNNNLHTVTLGKNGITFQKS